MDAPVNCPLVTFALFSYKQEQYVAHAISGVLQQDYQNLEIIISDDCSPDGTYKIIEAMTREYRGPHKVTINRNAQNMGIAAHFDKIMALASGEIVVVAAADDISMSDRTSRVVELFSSQKDATMVSFRDIEIDEKGNVINDRGDIGASPIITTLEEFISPRRRHFSGASRAYKKAIYETFGSLSKACPTEDSPYALRGLMLGKALISPKPAIYYRQHASSLSAEKSLNAMSVDEICDQYASDLGLAFRRGIVTDAQAHEINAWIARTRNKRTISKNLYYSKAKILFFLRFIFFSDEFTRKEKRNILLSILAAKRQA
jgi:glycosyltransferase involved in cell wall biosynthesis